MHYYTDNVCAQHVQLVILAGCIDCVSTEVIYRYAVCFLTAGTQPYGEALQQDT
jgi:hypothetical protein